MSLYQNSLTGEIRDINDDWLAQKVAEGSPKAAPWQPYTPPPQPPPGPHRVSKDTIISRLDAAGKLAEARALLNAQDALDQYRFTHSAWFWSDNAKLRALCQHATVALNPDELLAPDPYL